MQKYINLGTLKFLTLGNDHPVSSLYHFLSAKNHPNKYSWYSETTFSQQDFQNALFLIFFPVKSYEGGTSFSSQTTFFNAEISYEIKGIRFDQMKVSGRGWFSTVNKKPHQFHMIKSNKEVTRKTRETYFLHRKPQKLEIAKKIIFFENCFRKKWKISLAKSHSTENTKTGQLSQKY